MNIFQNTTMGNRDRVEPELILPDRVQCFTSLKKSCKVDTDLLKAGFH